MPRKSRSPVSPQDVQAFDAFALAKGSIPKAFEAPHDESANAGDRTLEIEDPTPGSGETNPRPGPDPDEPPVRRVGRRRTGRNVSFNQSVTAETANLFYDTQRKLDITMGEVLERAINALMEKMERGR